MLEDDSFFQNYGVWGAQVMMLQDTARMDAYATALGKGRGHVDGKVVLDVGTGTGVLAIFAARGGARRVYAIEASAHAASIARALVAAANLSDTITIMHGVAEDMVLPEAIDVIVSEWMGYLLFEEGMVHTVLRMRDRWLKPNGVMIPGTAQLRVAGGAHTPPPRSDLPRRVPTQKFAEFADRMRMQYELHFAQVDEQPAEVRNRWVQGAMDPSRLCGESVALASFDLHEIGHEGVADIHTNVTLPSTCDNLTTLVVWFEAQLVPGVPLSTSPGTRTHWGQVGFPLHTVALPPGEVALTWRMNQNGRWWRQHDVEIQFPGQNWSQVYPAQGSIW